MGIGRTLDLRSESNDLIGNTSPTSFLGQEYGAVGGVAAGLEEGGKAGEELYRLAGFRIASVMH